MRFAALSCLESPRARSLIILERCDGPPCAPAEMDAPRPFMPGWLQGDSAWGRPVDVEVLPDGSLAVSDDAAGVIYRISYAGPK